MQLSRPSILNKFLEVTQKALGTSLDISTAYHPETTDKVGQVSKPLVQNRARNNGEKHSSPSKGCKPLSDRQKSYANLKRKPMEFQVGDKVMLKVSPWKGVIRFGKRGKLNPIYVGPFKVLKKVGVVSYKLELPQELSRGPHYIHVSNLKKCYSDDPLVVPLGNSKLDENLQFVE
ncbi:hypothetical protein Tco_0153447 [Tanacetum coccineum]